jgi:hypothetical protein
MPAVQAVVLLFPAGSQRRVESLVWKNSLCSIEMLMFCNDWVVRGVRLNANVPSWTSLLGAVVKACSVSG